MFTLLFSEGQTGGTWKPSHTWRETFSHGVFPTRFQCAYYRQQVLMTWALSTTAVNIDNCFILSELRSVAMLDRCNIAVCFTQRTAVPGCGELQVQATLVSVTSSHVPVFISLLHKTAALCQLQQFCWRCRLQLVYWRLAYILTKAVSACCKRYAVPVGRLRACFTLQITLVDISNCPCIMLFILTNRIKLNEPSVLCTDRFNIQQSHVLPTQLYLCALCGSENKQRLFPYTTITDWFF